MNKTFTIKKIMLATLWIAIGGGSLALLAASIQRKDEKHCTGVNINIDGVSNNFFVDKKDILQVVKESAKGNPVGMPTGSFDLKTIEAALQRNTWVKNAQLYFDNNEVLQVKVLEREPVARVFATSGNTFYVDSSLAMLPLSDKFSARLPVFTNFPDDKKVLLKEDSLLLKDVVNISEAIHKNTFLMAMIDQVDITAQRSFEMIPKIGNAVIVFGDGANTADKFTKLTVFYKEVLAKAGWNKYSTIDVQYKGQVVAKKKGVEEVKADSLRTLQLMKSIAENAERMSADSLQAITQDNESNTTNTNIIQQSIERDDNASSNTSEKPQPQEGVIYEKPTLPAVAHNPSPKPVATATKPKLSGANAKTVTKPAPVKEPKFTMPKGPPKKPAAAPKTNNDY